MFRERVHRLIGYTLFEDTSMVAEISTATRTEVLGAIRSRYREASKGRQDQDVG